MLVAIVSSMLHNLLFKAIFGQDYPNLGRLCNILPCSVSALSVRRWSCLLADLWDHHGVLVPQRLDIRVFHV